MAELFNFGEVETKEEVGGGNSQKYIYPGIRHEVVIKSVKEGSPEGKSPYVELEMYTKDGGPETARSFKFYTSKGDIAKTMEKIKHIATKVATQEEVTAAKNVDDLRDILKGKKLRMKFTGEQWKNESGEIKERALIGLPPFAEAIEDGAAYPAVANEDTKLTFDKTNKYDFKLLEEGDEVPTAPQEAAPWSLGG